jgi:hypothetical protein
MVVGISEGSTLRCEVLAGAEGYVVQVRDLQTSRLEESDRMLFRTAVAALAYADLLATLDETTSARLDGEEDRDLEAELDARRLAFSTLADRLLDRGIDMSSITARDDQETRPPRHRLH